ncbi:hypothetical protein [Sediminicoccus sp. KRV36]|uniref:hypothetical protein n=1 Tax=Sediminicoccus sp. KRV36 TaxID=3133721 RepID=UPI00200D6A4A|nr:hypothetical protein [Sediminicoccus rosea]UPY38253.1 hypothetical protein LHU95_06020 [Sediminicoccus rosea]
MTAPSRRHLLAAACMLPGLGRAQDLAATDLSIVLAGESPRLGASVMDDLFHNNNLALPVGTLRQEVTPWIAGDLHEEVEAGLPGMDAVLTNAAGFALGAARDLWHALPARLLDANTPHLSPAGQLVQARLGEAGLVVGTIPGGPVLVHRRSVLPVAPRNAAALLDYARENPRRFQYTRPGQSRFGQAFITSMPYLLKDPNPLDPENGWTGSWPYLLELGRAARFYPSSGRAAAEEFIEGSVELMPALLGSYLLGMATGLLPTDTMCTPFDDVPLVPHSLILVVPRGVPEQRLALLDPLIAFMREPGPQRLIFGRGLIPGNPARDGASLDLSANDRLWTAAMTPELAASLTGRPTAPPLDPAAEAAMLRLWDDRIGSRYGETL